MLGEMSRERIGHLYPRMWSPATCKAASVTSTSQKSSAANWALCFRPRSCILPTSNESVRAASLT